MQFDERDVRIDGFRAGWSPIRYRATHTLSGITLEAMHGEDRGALLMRLRDEVERLPIEASASPTSGEGDGNG
jgi:hypothetical protein